MRSIALRLVLLAAASLLLAACSRADSGPKPRQGSPEEVIQTAQAFIEADRADRLHELLLADDPRMRELFRRTGVLLGSLQRCSQTFAEKYPAEVERLRIEAQNSPALAGLLSRRGRSHTSETIGLQLRRVLADPYAVLDEQAQRISTIPLDDNTSAIMIDDMPVLPPLGMVMTQRNDRWYIVPPLNVPFLGRFLPQTDDEYAILAYLIQVLDNAVTEIEADINSGRLTDTEDLSRAAGEKIFIPGSMIVLAYNRAIESRDNNDDD